MLSRKAIIYILLSTLLNLISNAVFAQNNYHLHIEVSNKSDIKTISKIKYTKKLSSESFRNKEINKVFMQIYAESYVEAQLDSSQIEGNIKTIFISLNQKYQWENLRKGNLNQIVINDIDFHEKDFIGKDFNFHNILRIEESIIQFYENHGYPFATISLDSIEIKDYKISAAFNLATGPLIHIDTIVLNNFTQIHPKYIYRLLDIKPGDVYNESKIKRVSHQLASMSFAREAKDFSIAFTPTKASLNLNLEKQRINMFDGIIGFQPNSGTDNKLVLTGNLRLKLVNSFKRGELIDINWRSPQGGSQNLDVNFAYPYLFNSPIGIDYKFKLLKQDSSYLNIRNEPGLSFIINGLDYIKVSANFFSSQTLSTTLVNNKPLNQDVLDLRSSIAKLELNINRLNYILNPRKGWWINISGGYGTKDIIKQHNIDEAFYDSIPLHSKQLELHAHLEYFIPLFKRQTIRLANASGMLSGDYLLSNELYRIGGFSDLRGFDEESIYASTYSIFTVEWRLLLERNSYLNVFWNGAYVENNTQNNITYDQPMGFGAGISFQTKAGIFALSYALGRQLGNAIELNSAKIHFGFMARF